MLFTKVYKEEDVRLRGCSYNVASVYFHLKNKRDYFKSKNNGSCYDLTKCISEYTGMCEKTIKRAIATLKKLGLISTVLKGKVNHYSFPILDAIENNTPIEEVIKNTTDLSYSNDEEVEQPQPIRDNAAESLKMGNNEIAEDNTYMERKPSMEIATSKQDSNMERLQYVINTDDDFYKVYNNCIKAVAEYKLSNGDIIKANSKDMAMQKLKNLCHSYQIPYNEETYNFILKDVNYSISNMGSYSVA